MMKKTVVLAFAVILCICAVCSGCAPTYSKSPDRFEGIRWITYDYSFCIKPDDGCTGFYRYNDKKYNIKVSFEGSTLKAVDTDNGDMELFNGDWMYETKDDDNELLYVYNIRFNKDDYKEFESNFAEYVTLKQETI